MFWNFIIIFCHNGFFKSFCLFFGFNPYAWRFSYTESIQFPSSSSLFEWKVPWEFPVALQWAIFFYRLFFLLTMSIIYFAAGISLLRGPISFLPREFFFYREVFSFAAIIFLLPRVFFFCPDLFLFCRQHFSFTAKISLLPGAFFFCRDTWGPPYEGHENHLQIADSFQKKPCFFKVIPGVFGRSVNFNITSRFLLGRPVFPDYLSVSYDYVKTCNYSAFVI